MSEPHPDAASAFDLNIEKVLEGWAVSDAVREFIANALDEHHLTATRQPEIVRRREGVWTIQDFGRGLSHKHLTQNENPEKRQHSAVIGQFGIGLKDALAVCDRRGVTVTIRSQFGDITTQHRPKAGFADVPTLHAIIRPPSEPALVGTVVELRGVSDEDIETAKSLFLLFAGDEVLETTKYGAVIAKPSAKAPGRIYLKGLRVNEEENFLFSYNITEVNAALRKALNRERHNVGRGAYTDRIKQILKECQSAAVADALTTDLSRFGSGRMHDELGWRDVALHACRVLNAKQRVVFVTAWQMGTAAVEYAKQDGIRIIVVSDDIARGLRDLTDLNGEPIRDLDEYQNEFNNSFVFNFVDEELTETERRVMALLEPTMELANYELGRFGIKHIRISETMRLDSHGAEVVGLCDKANEQIVIRRDQLRDPVAFCGTLLHEIAHAMSGAADYTLAFENALTERLGTVAVSALRN